MSERGTKYHLESLESESGCKWVRKTAPDIAGCLAELDQAQATLSVANVGCRLLAFGVALGLASIATGIVCGITSFFLNAGPVVAFIILGIITSIAAGWGYFWIGLHIRPPLMARVSECERAYRDILERTVA